MNYVIKAIGREGNLSGKVPLWFMRQAGRYLPEYRAIRSKYNNFLDFCYSEKDASEVTIQPLVRYDIDAAIIFSDILVIPDMLGFEVNFSEGYGPSINLKNSNYSDIFNDNKLYNLKKSIEITKNTLKDFSNKDFIGFVGAPLTLLYYILEEDKTKREETLKKEIEHRSNFLNELLFLMEEKCAEFLIHQYESGVNILKIFDSHAGLLRNKQDLEKFSVKPIHNIIKKVREKIPQAAIIIFPRGVGEHIDMYEEITKLGNVALALSEEQDVARVKTIFDCCLQGNISNNIFFQDKDELKREVKKLTNIINPQKHIVNLGHGILPQTDPDMVKLLIDEVRNYESRI